MSKYYNFPDHELEFYQGSDSKVWECLVDASYGSTVRMLTYACIAPDEKTARQVFGKLGKVMNVWPVSDVFEVLQNTSLHIVSRSEGTRLVQ